MKPTLGRYIPCPPFIPSGESPLGTGGLDEIKARFDALRVERLEILPKNSRLFAVMAEGPLAEIEKLRRQIEEQAQLLAAA